MMSSIDNLERDARNREASLQAGIASGIKKIFKDGISIYTLILAILSFSGTILNQASRGVIDGALGASTRHISRELRSYIQRRFERAVEIRQKPSRVHMASIFRSVKKVEKSIIRNGFSRDAKKILNTLLTGTRTGYSLSRSTWNLASTSMTHLRRITVEGVRLGRDGAAIAKDINKYVLQGKTKGFAKKYANLMAGGKRLPDNIDYRAVRLARSEVVAASHEAANLGAMANPSVEGVIWNLSSAHPEDCGECICEKLADESPHPKGPDAPTITDSHPNCLCYITYDLVEGFEEDIENWSAGERIGYLDDWYGGWYRTASRV
jgi:hypothetical protein